MEWNIIENEDVIIYKLVKNNHLITWNELYSNINLQFVKSFIEVLTNCKFNEYYLEFNPVSYSTLDKRIFEFVLVKTKICLNADFTPFNKFNINSNTNDIRVFPNLSNTSILISPCYNKLFNIQSYAHIGIFMKNFNTKQQIDLIYTMFSVYITTLKSKPNDFMWLSTHGKGVGWLHIRIDTQPKYITWLHYKSIK